jgi:hypothetical protein
LREVRGAGVLRFGIDDPRRCLADLRRKHSNLLLAHPGINVLARCNRDIQGCTRLPD